MVTKAPTKVPRKTTAKVAVKSVGVKPASTPPVAAKKAVTVPVKPAPQVAPAAVLKEKLKKPKLVRDSFTMPEAEYLALADLKKSCIKAGFEVKKSELLRVGVALMQKSTTAQLKQVLATLPSLKAGRPKNTK